MGTATRYSPKREAILKCLRSTTCHPSAEWVYTQLKPQIPDLSLATVYRNLARFRSEGAVQVIGCVDGEDRYDGNVAPHGHFICRGCGAVIDLPPIPVDAPDLAQVGRQESYSVTFYGRCNQCLVKEKIS